MRTAIDTNVISALWSQEPASSSMAASLIRARGEGGLVVCAVVYVELLAHPKVTAAFANEFLSNTGIAVDFNFNEAVWQEAARSFTEYARRRRRSRGGTTRRLLADFVIGAHAVLMADRFFTLEASRYNSAFPKLRMFV